MKLISESRWYIVAMLAVCAAAVWALVLGSLPVSGSRQILRVSIPRGSSARSIAATLHEQGVIRSPMMFVLTCRLSGTSGTLKPGIYGIARNLGVPEIVEMLAKGHSLEVWVTIPEGYTVRQIADVLNEKQIVDGDSFARMAISYGSEFASQGFLLDGSLEGYLFPDTYLLERGRDSEYIILKMLSTFEGRIVGPLRAEIERTALERFKLSEDQFDEGLHRIITMASLVEREARVPSDRPIIAGVLWNRLERGMRLEVCATVSYVPGESRENKQRVYTVDTLKNSPYNTYRNAGLPPGPICNPGLASVKAVLDPAKVDYLFYLAKPDGSHVFSRTYAEHLAAKRRVESGGP